MKKRHVLRNILLVLLVLVLSVLLVVGVLIVDFGDNTPEYVSEVENTELGDYMGDKAEREADRAGLLGDFEYLFNEEELNKILYMIIRDVKIPMVKIKSVYLNIDENDKIYAEAPFWAFIYHSRAKLNCTISYDDEVVRLRVDDIRVRGFSSTKGIVRSILSEDMVKELNQSLREQGIEITMWKEDEYIYAEMTNIDICKTIINTTKERGVGFLAAALVAGTLNHHSIDIVVNQNGLTGIVVHKSLL